MGVHVRSTVPRSMFPYNPFCRQNYRVLQQQIAWFADSFLYCAAVQLIAEKNVNYK